MNRMKQVPEVKSAMKKLMPFVQHVKVPQVETGSLRFFENTINQMMWQYVERKPHQFKLVFMWFFCPGRVVNWSVCFCGGRKTREPGEKSLERGKNKQRTQPTCDIRLVSNLEHIVER